MSALPPDQMREMRETAERGMQPLDALAERWLDLHEQAGQIAAIAGLAPEPFTEELAAFPERLKEATIWKVNLAWQGIDDIDAMLQPGITALRTITARGQNASAPAMTLWREFHAARGAVLELVAGTGAQVTQDAA